MEKQSEVNENTPLQSPPKKPRYADRFIPSRNGNGWHMTFPETPTHGHQPMEDPQTPKRHESELSASEERKTPYSCLLKNEVLGYDYDNTKVLSSPKAAVCRRLFHYDMTERPVKNPNSDSFSAYAASPVSESSQKLVSTPSRKLRRIPKVPYKILDAPDFADDYYLNLLDWSSQDVICIGLGTNVYTWTASNCRVEVLTNLQDQNDIPTSVRWNEKGNRVAVGSNKGIIRIWDVEADKLILEQRSHEQRIGVIDWNNNTIMSGSRDKKIQLMDCRSSSSQELVLGRHSQEVCGLKWSSLNSCLASGGNDNTVSLWNLHSTKPVLSLREHSAAVKAISWSPHDSHILTTGGGTSDRSLKFWNTITGVCTDTIDTKSQVCNVAWSLHSKELVSTHGYAHNSVSIWKYPSMKLEACLKGHTQRVLYMAMSPDGRSVCTGAADETLRFWNVFEPSHSRVKKSPLDLFKGIR